MATAGLEVDGNIISTASSINFDKASKTSGQSDATAAHASDDSVQGSDVVGLLTAEERDYAIIVLQKITYVILPFALLVTVCNVVVFVQRSLRNSTSKYIIALSLAQIIYICIDIGARIMVASFERGIPPMENISTLKVPEDERKI
nr:hypothetical protein BaRGS_004912 [Batillaria attramentaria]